MSSEDSNQFYKYLREKARKANSLLSLHIDITYRCPQNCIHCYIDHRHLYELSTTEIEKILKDARKLNALFITYSGGEVFLRKDFEDILKITKRLGFSIKIITSGYLISEKEIEIIYKYKLTSVGISLYSLVPEIHDKITGVKGSCERTTNAIKMLTKRGINTVVKTSIMKQNYREYPELIKWIRSLGNNVYAQYDMVITPSMELRSGVRSLNIPFSEKKRLYKILKDIEHKEDLKVEELEDSKREEIGNESVTCYAGITGLYIAPDGKVYPCVEWNELLGDLRKESLIDMWKYSKRIKEIKSLRIKDYKKCYSCKYLYVCSICPGLNLRDNNNIFNPPDLPAREQGCIMKNSKRSKITIEFIRDTIKKTGSFRFQTQGNSMFPFILDGDEVIIERIEPEDLRPGDVVMYVRGSKMVIHRIIKIYTTITLRKLFILKGDNLSYTDQPVWQEDIGGKATRIIRGNREYSIYSFHPLLISVARFILNQGRILKSLLNLSISQKEISEYLRRKRK